jgi:integrase
MTSQNKKPRRGHGEGAIYWRESRKRWVAELPLETGKSKYFTGKTYAEAQRKLKQAQIEQQQGKLATGPKQTVKQFLEHWLEHVHKANIRINSYRIYRQLLDNHLLPALGHHQLQRLSPQHIDELYAQKRKEGFAVETIRAMHRLLRRALQDAVRWSLVSSNVCDKVTPPRQVKFEAQALSGEQVKQLLEVAKGSPIEVLLTLALTTGMRVGEMIALRWADIDLQDGSLQVRHTVSRVGKRFQENGLVENDPKTESSRRKIVLPQFVLEALKRHREHQVEVRDKAGSAWQEKDIVFSNHMGGFLERANINTMLKGLLKQAGLPEIRIHDLRHSAATILLKMNINPKQVQVLLGHSSIVITMDRYSHVLPDMQRGMMDQLDDYFGPS